jgi:hypothetical protein
MKRNSLTTALLAGLAGVAGMASTANALNINPDGIGQVLIYPYYTVNKGNQTLISVVNTTSAVKAVKVRILEGRNSREVLDFNLYLSPFDVWVGSIEASGATGPARLKTPDTSCTVPQIPGAGTAAWTLGGVDFRNFEYSNLEPIGGANRRDHPSSLVPVYESLDRTREGYIEMIDMGVLSTGTGLTRLAEEATHVRPAAVGTVAAVPANCSALVLSWTEGQPGGWWAEGGEVNVGLPNGGLYGGGSIVDVANGTMISYNADALDGFYTNAARAGFLHTNPGFVEPDLGDCDNGGGNCDVYLFENFTGRALTLRFAAGGAISGWDAVSSLYMSDAIFNEYVTDTAIASKSEWVVNFPTKEVYVRGSTNPAIPPFRDVFENDGQACESIDITIWNREEMTGTPGSVDFSPRPPGASGPTLCFEAQVVTFNQTLTNTAGNSTSPSGIFGATYARNLSTTAPAGVVNNPATAPQLANGHTRIRFNGPQGGPRPAIQVLSVLPGGTATQTGTLFGLPVTGFWAWTAVNSAAQPGLLANFSGAFRHRSSRVTSGI